MLSPNSKLTWLKEKMMSWRNKELRLSKPLIRCSATAKIYSMRTRGKSVRLILQMWSTKVTQNLKSSATFGSIIIKRFSFCSTSLQGSSRWSTFYQPLFSYLWPNRVAFMKREMRTELFSYTFSCRSSSVLELFRYTRSPTSPSTSCGIWWQAMGSALPWGRPSSVRKQVSLVSWSFNCFRDA